MALLRICILAHNDRVTFLCLVLFALLRCSLDVQHSRWFMSCYSFHTVLQFRWRVMDAVVSGLVLLHSLAEEDLDHLLWRYFYIFCLEHFLLDVWCGYCLL